MLSNFRNRIACLSVIAFFTTMNFGQANFVYAASSSSVSNKVKSSVAKSSTTKTIATKTVNANNTNGNVSVASATDQIIVKYKSTANIQNLSSKKNDTIKTNNKKLRIAKIKIGKGKSVSQKLSEYRKDSSVEYAEPDYIMKLEETPSDSLYNNQWGIPKINADQAWTNYSGSSNVVVAIIDTGADSDHPDLKASFVTGFNEITQTTNTEDDHGHGTHCSGIAAGIKDNGIGIAGVASGCKIMPVKVLGANGFGYTSDILNGVIWATDNYQSKGGQKLVISMSLGGNGYSQSFQDAINYAHDKGVLVVAAAGNNNTSTPSYPAAYDNVISVAATDSNNNRASFSNFGTSVDVAAPGVNILSTTNDGDYGYMSGTSMATPFVAGDAALIWSKEPNLTPLQLERVIENTAQDLGTVGKDTYFGYGLIDVNAGINKQVDTSPLQLMVTSSTNEFSPTKSKGYITFTLGTNAQVLLQVYNSTNTLVKTILNNVSKLSGINTACWDGKDSLGKIVPDGTYTYKISATDTNGTKSSVITGNIIIDGTAPKITNLTVSANPYSPLNGSISINYTLDETAIVTTGIYNSNNCLVKQLEKSISKNSGTYTFTWDGKNTKGILAPDDTYTVKVSAIDLFKNSTITPTTVSFILDFRTPVISNVKPLYLYFRPLGKNLDTISFTLSEKCAVNVSILDNNGSTVKTLISGMQTAGSKLAGWDGKNSSGFIVPDGVYTYKILATDILNNIATPISGTITVDTTPPQITNVSYGDNIYSPTGTNLTTFGYTLSETAKVTVAICSPTGTVKTLENLVAKNAGTYILSWDGRNTNGLIVPDNKYYLKLTAIDNANISSIITTSTFIVDSRNPIISKNNVSFPSFKPTGKNWDTIYFTLSETTYSYIEIYNSSNVLVRKLANNIMMSGGSKTITWDGRNDAGQFVGDGIYTYKIYGSDILGNLSNIVAGNIVIDTTAPTLSCTTSSVSFHPTGLNTLTETYTLSEKAKVTIKIYDSRNYVIKVLQSNILKDSGINSIMWNGKNNYNRIVSTGNYRMVIIATDLVGLTTTLSNVNISII